MSAWPAAGTPARSSRCAQLRPRQRPLVGDERSTTCQGPRRHGRIDPLLGQLVVVTGVSSGGVVSACSQW